MSTPITILKEVNFEKFATLLNAINRIEKLSHSYTASARIHFLRNVTIEGVEPFLKYYLVQSDINPTITFGGYDTVQQDLLDTQSPLKRESVDVLVLSLFLETLAPDYKMPMWKADDVLKKLGQIFNQVINTTQSLIVVNTFLSPLYSESGIASAPLLENRTAQVERLNQFIRAFVQSHAAQFFLINSERLLCLVGETDSFDYRYWYLSKSPFKKMFLNLYALELAKVIRALKGKAKKVLVLDCDNTLWGGIIGEDGISGIQLGTDQYPDVIFYEFQQTILQFIERGILVALCSKNNEGEVWDVLENHPKCLLKRAHLSSWRINWEDKISNIQSLSEELNLGLDSIVFVDDNPLECELVEQYLPDVTVLRVPKNLAYLPQLLFKQGWFDTLSASQEDKKRVKMVQNEALRQATIKQFEDLDDYLASLNLEASIQLATHQTVVRIAQLTQKTNQFNLTTRRYSENDIVKLLENPDNAVFTLSIQDKFGDYGLTGVCIVEKNRQQGIIDTLLLSCRILGRKLEQVFVNYCLTRLETQWNVTEWQAEYIPTSKNAQVSDFWLQFGFEEYSHSSIVTQYKLCADRRISKSPSFIRITI